MHSYHLLVPTTAVLVIVSTFLSRSSEGGGSGELVPLTLVFFSLDDI